MDALSDVRKRVILITGATGFTGSHACRYFAGLGMQVAAIVRQVKPADHVDGVKYYRCDLRDRARVEELVHAVSPDYVLHLGGKNSVPESWQDPLTYMETNLLFTLYLLNALRPFPSCRILVAGSMTVFPLAPPFRPTHPYGLSKSLQQTAAVSWGLLYKQSVMIAEPANLIGPGPSTGFCALLGRYIAAWEQGKAAQAFQVSSRSAQRDFLDVRDAVKAYGYLLEHGNPGEIYPIRSGRYVSLGEIADLFIEISGSKPPIDWGDSDDWSKAGSQEPPGLQLADWQPAISLRTSLQDILLYYRSQEGGSS
ncbi:GDP-4-dehydro-6-deoxy-D-mannose reductase [Paenibacillus rhizosphaerae]|uniref:GDP-4-dehydro-6-deoxy-D-mannose reductase n=1 Tax=Paenibacillus rhizosphaerae TaxID=297318 RepID=A0A839TZ23_9BACL|nr:NAD-dependent epimerase/dehydratase family protein [Paenibacillus rhizosphaerae]MBB3131721.1 GDP-4-dehydro-6-deoxy-D-mannose reductase [Paenibacillus rhizosphaerae]